MLCNTRLRCLTTIFCLQSCALSTAADAEHKRLITPRTRRTFVKVFIEKGSKHRHHEKENMLQQQARTCCIHSRKHVESACGLFTELSTYYDNASHKKNKFCLQAQKGQMLMNEISDKTLYKARTLKSVMQLIDDLDDYITDYIGKIHSDETKMPHYAILDELVDTKADYYAFVTQRKLSK